MIPQVCQIGRNLRLLLRVIYYHILATMTLSNERNVRVMRTKDWVENVLGPGVTLEILVGRHGGCEREHNRLLGGGCEHHEHQHRLGGCEHEEQEAANKNIHWSGSPSSSFFADGVHAEKKDGGEEEELGQAARKNKINQFHSQKDGPPPNYLQF
jgi:hypothetical protein